MEYTPGNFFPCPLPPLRWCGAVVGNMVDILLGPRPLDLLSPRVPGHLDELLQLFNQFFERETRGDWREEEWEKR